MFAVATSLLRRYGRDNNIGGCKQAAAAAQASRSGSSSTEHGTASSNLKCGTYILLTKRIFHTNFILSINTMASSSLKYKGSAKHPPSNNPSTASSQDDDRKKDSLLAQYQSLLRRYPLPMNALQSSTIAGIGVSLSQLYSYGSVMDTREVRVMMMINVIYHTPILYAFYTFVLPKLQRF